MCSHKLSAVIPTKNRPDDLARAVASIYAQRRLPDELIIVDQSDSDASRVAVSSLVTPPSMELVHIHDPQIAGLVAAKKVAAETARGDIVCYLEDDVILEADYLLQIERGFVDHPEMVGCSGVISNSVPRSRFYQFFFDAFRRGIYKDRRDHIYARARRHSPTLMVSDVLSGGVSAWRREVLEAVPFDTLNGFFMLEDMEFSTRVAKLYGPRLFINPAARLEHHSSPANREHRGARHKRKVIEYIAYYKKRRDWPWAHVALAWLLVGLLGETVVQSVAWRSLSPMAAYLAGVRDGLRKHVQC